jgi:hypothetical protein
MRRLASAIAVLLALSLAASAVAVIEQKGNLRVAVKAKISPSKLPRQGAAPISVSVGGEVSTTDLTLPPQLRRLVIEINREGHLEHRGLPPCRYRQIQPATNERALAACRDSLVGQGTFDAYILLGGGQPPYPAHGRLLLFHGTKGKAPLLFGHIYISKPFAASFIITFEIKHTQKGRYGTILSANLARDLGSRRYLTAIEMTLSRRYSFGGRRRSYLSAGCPAPEGLSRVAFSLVRTSFVFAGGERIRSTLVSSCRVRG